MAIESKILKMAESVDISRMSVTISEPVDLFRQLRRLLSAESVSASRLTMVQIPPILMHLPALSSLDLSSNPIHSLDIQWEADLPSLHELNLSACWLRDLPYGVPRFAPTLETLILDGNFLGRSCPNFTVFGKLRHLSLVGNDFLEFPKLPQTLHTLTFRMNAFSEVPPCSVSVLDASYCDVFSGQSTEPR
jgi:hypothetical protein